MPASSTSTGFEKKPSSVVDAPSVAVLRPPVSFSRRSSFVASPIQAVFFMSAANDDADETPKVETSPHAAGVHESTPSSDETMPARVQPTPATISQ